MKQNLPFSRQFFEWEMYNNLLLIQHSFFHIYGKKIRVPNAGSLQKNFDAVYQAFFKEDSAALDKLQREANTLAEKEKQHYFCELAIPDLHSYHKHIRIQED